MFGYGSLMWRPGFEFIEQVPARLIGEHRALCVYSFVHRGTPEKPGLVLGLDRGGACRGIAFRVAAKHRAATIAYLREREQVTSVYREVMRSVWLENEARQRVSALAYVVDRGHVQYAGRLSLAEQLRHVLQGHGQSGVNRDYVLSTVKAIEAEGFRDQQLHRLAAMLHDQHPRPFPQRTATAERRRAHPQWPISRSFSRKWRVPVGLVLSFRRSAAMSASATIIDRR